MFGVRVMGCVRGRGRGVQGMGTGIWCMTGKSDGVERVVWYVGAVRICEIVGTVCKLQVHSISA